METTVNSSMGSTEYDKRTMRDRISRAASAVTPRIPSNQFVRSSSFGWLLIGAALGSLLTFVLDPISGNRRRAFVREKGIKAKNTTTWYANRQARNLSNRAKGIVARSHHLGADESVDDETLMKRVRSEFGRVVTHAKSIQAFVKNGEVTLTGPILAHEVKRLVSCVADVRGVKNVVNHLDIHQTAENIPGLQGEGKEYLRQPNVLT